LRVGLVKKLAAMMPVISRAQKKEKKDFLDLYGEPTPTFRVDAQILAQKTKEYRKKAIVLLSGKVTQRMPRNPEMNDREKVRWLLQQLDGGTAGVLVRQFDSANRLFKIQPLQSPFSFGLQPVLSLRF